jgi:D-alanine-D-alanine ligase
MPGWRTPEEMVNPYKPKRIGVVMGGLSSEREISLETGKGVHEALEGIGYASVPVDWTEGGDLPAVLRSERIEVVWNALHGTYGEDGCVQGLLESIRIPYTGSGVTASALGMEKIFSKGLFDRNDVRTPPWRRVAGIRLAEEAASEFGYPVVVKPSREGSTVGVSIVTSPSDLESAVAAADRCHGSVLVEQFIPGHEISVAVLDDQAIGTVEIRPKSGFYDYQAKYKSKETEYLVPAPFPPAVQDEMLEAGLEAYRVIGCAAHARVDMRVTDAGEVWVLEVNTLPGMTERSLFPKMARHAGIDYPGLVERILASAALHA